jgi:imidazolonepropionase-like amidohydrolase
MILVDNATVIDGTGADARPRTSMLVDGERIAWVGPADAVNRHQPIEHTVDAAGKYVIPGLIDAHVHVCWNGRDSILDLLKRERDHLLLEAVATLGSILASGTTTVRDIGGQDYMEMALRRAVQAGHIHGPRMRVSGRLICMTGGHGHFIAREADGPDELRRAAREQIKAGADTIKLMATGGIATPGQDVQAAQLTVEELAAAVQVAHAMGRTTAAHCHGVGGIKNSVLAGIDSIEHGSFLDEETADMMVERGVALVLTLGVANPNVEDLSPAARAEAERMRGPMELLRARVRESVALARAKGVFVGSGSDAGGNALAPHDFSMARELEELVGHGFSPLEALTLVTRNNARILRWENDLGTLEAGKLADFVVLAGDPLADISNVRKVEAVYKSGQKVVG